MYNNNITELYYYTLILLLFNIFIILLLSYTLNLIIKYPTLSVSTIPNIEYTVPIK